MDRRSFLKGFGATILSTASIPSVAASGPDIPPYPSTSDSHDLLSRFEEEQLGDNDGDVWSWSLTRYIHREKAEECSEEVNLDTPPYALYAYHLNAGRRLSLEPATEKQGACVDTKVEYKNIEFGRECLMEIEILGSEPELTEVGDKAKSLFQDRLEEDLPISSGEWEFGLQVPGFVRDSEWEYTKSDADLLDKRTFTAEIESEEREEIDNQIAGRNNLEIRCFLTTETASRTGHYLAVIGIVPDSDSVDTDGILTDPVEFNPEEYRDNIRTLKKAISE